MAGCPWCQDDDGTDNRLCESCAQRLYHELPPIEAPSKRHRGKCNYCGAAMYALSSGSSDTHTYTMTSSNWGFVGVRVVQTGGGGGSAPMFRGS